MPTSETRSRFTVELIPSSRERISQTNNSLPFPKITYPITNQTLSENVVLSDNLIIQWNSVPNAVEYTISITEPGGYIWETITNETQIHYPGTVSSQRGTTDSERNTYFIEVRANTGSRLLDERRSTGVVTFSLIDKITAQEISETVDKITELDISDETKTFAIAQLYSQNNLFTEAITTLKSFSPGLYKSPAGYRLLGDLYRHLNIEEKSRKAYVLALSVAEGRQAIIDRQDAGEFGSYQLDFLDQPGSLRFARLPRNTLNISRLYSEEKANILAGLGELYFIFRDFEEGGSFIREARDIYIHLEGPDSAIAESLEPSTSLVDLEGSNRPERASIVIIRGPQLIPRSVREGILERTTTRLFSPAR